MRDNHLALSARSKGSDYPRDLLLPVHQSTLKILSGNSVLFDLQASFAQHIPGQFSSKQTLSSSI
jgi:hypothetical protein